MAVNAGVVAVGVAFGGATLPRSCCSRPIWNTERGVGVAGRRWIMFSLPSPGLAVRDPRSLLQEGFDGLSEVVVLHELEIDPSQT